MSSYILHYDLVFSAANLITFTFLKIYIYIIIWKQSLTVIEIKHKSPSAKSFETMSKIGENVNMLTIVKILPLFNSYNKKNWTNDFH